MGAAKIRFHVLQISFKSRGAAEAAAEEALCTHEPQQPQVHCRHE